MYTSKYSVCVNEQSCTECSFLVLPLNNELQKADGHSACSSERAFDTVRRLVAFVFEAVYDGRPTVSAKCLCVQFSTSMLH